jgi:hypothetical protein
MAHACAWVSAVEKSVWGEPAAADSLPAPLATPKIQYRTQTLWQQAFWCRQALKSGTQNGNSG